jgi:hypothetical protein
MKKEHLCYSCRHYYVCLLMNFKREHAPHLEVTISECNHFDKSEDVKEHP